MWRAILGVLAGVVAAGAAVTLTEMLGHAIWPPPPGLNMNDPAAVQAYAAAAPDAAKNAIILAWGLGALIGGFIAAKITAKAWAGYLIAGLLLVGALINLAMIPSPAWMWSGGLFAIAIGGWLAVRLARV